MTPNPMASTAARARVGDGIEAHGLPGQPSNHAEIVMERGRATTTHVVIAGAGIAGVEAMLALRALGDEQVRVTVIAPTADPVFYRPLATVEAFQAGEPTTYDVEAITSDLGADYKRARLVFVGSRKRVCPPVLRRSRDVRRAGARDRHASGGRNRGRGDVPRSARRCPHCAGFCAKSTAERFAGSCSPCPQGHPGPCRSTNSRCCWRLVRRRTPLDTEVTLVSPEQMPLAVFGADHLG